MDYKQILAANETELQSVAGLLGIQGAGASDSRAILQAGELKLDLDAALGVKLPLSVLIEGSSQRILGAHVLKAGPVDWHR